MRERAENLAVVRGAPEPPRSLDDAGAMVTVVDRGGIGYAATPDLTESGLRRAAAEATDWAHRSAPFRLFDPPEPAERAAGEYQTPARVDWWSVPLAEKLGRLREAAAHLRADPRIADWAARLGASEIDVSLVSSDGPAIRQRFRLLVPILVATANAGPHTETRSFGGHAWCRQGGLETLDAIGFWDAAPRVAAEAIELLDAPNCPSERMDLLLAPDQMILQIHESIGHPLELDRILGDERNYAGGSFVTPEMFGTYRYGSELLDVIFDPGRPGELASYAFDDDGTPARRDYLIRGGILLRPLGGALSQARSGLAGVACSRARSWNRPPIDRMANLNLEPGRSSFDDMVKATERGILLQTNCSWSIDDSRNKFQFGCERGRLIRDGELREVVRKPSYRGVSATFWRSLRRVGNAATAATLGTPYCGKGEPNQVIHVGHSAPACLFADVDVFGGVD